MTILPYILYLFLLAFHQVILRDVTAIYGATIDLTGFMVLAVSMYKSEETSIWFGFFAGLVTAAGRPEVLGWYALLTAALAAAAYHAREQLNLESLKSKMALIFGGLVVYNLATTVADGLDGFFFRLGVVALPGAVYTLVVAWIFFLFKEERVTIKKIKALF